LLGAYQYGTDPRTDYAIDKYDAIIEFLKQSTDSTAPRAQATARTHSSSRSHSWRFKPPSWGAMLNDARAYLFDAPHLVLFPASAVMVAVLSFNFIGDALRDLLDPRSRIEAGL